MHVKYIIYFLSKDRDATPDSPSKRFSVAGYNKVIKKLLNTFGDKNVTEKAVKGLGLTDYMTNKIIQCLKKPIPQNVEPEILRTTLINITGIGPKKADVLIASGLKKISQLNQKKYQAMLNTDSKAATKHQPIKRIPREIILELEPILTKFTNSILVGSFRRKKSTSKDIDIMVVSKHENVLEKYINHLKKHFTVELYAQGNDKMSILIKYKKQYLKIDVFRALPVQKYAMLLYSTGSKMFNIRMRSKAKKMGYLLNQNGLFKDGKKIDVRSEKGFFTKLKMDYVEPHRR